MTTFYIRGTEQQRAIVQSAIKACDFPYERMLASLRCENTFKINVDFKDLSLYADTISDEFEDGNAHGHVKIGAGAYDAHPIVRPIAGRSRVLGLFYLPPHTAIVLDESLIHDPPLAREVFLAEVAHAVDYHYMTSVMRREFWNAVHPESQDVGVGTFVASAEVNHEHSWFDGEAGYDAWVGEAWMQGFVNIFAPDIAYTMPLAHSCPVEAAPHLRRVLLGEVEPDDEATGGYWWRFLCYLRDLFTRWYR